MRLHSAKARRRTMHRWAVESITFAIVGMLVCAMPEPATSIHTRDSLSIRQGTYSWLFFFAEPVSSPATNLPRQYRFELSGVIPPGMKFEVFPCNKLGTEACSQKASSNGIFIDGTPLETGSYTFVITAISPGKKPASQKFTISVKSPDSPK